MGAIVSVGMLGPVEIELDRRVLGPRDFEGVKPKQVLEILLLERGRRHLVATARGGYAIDADPVDVDVDRFGALLRRAATLPGVERRSALEAAVALARRAAWVLAERRHVAELQVQGLPTAERAHRAAMRTYHACADRDAALRAHVRCGEALSEELGISPAPETSRLHVAIPREEPVAMLLPGRGDAATALGRPMAVNDERALQPLVGHLGILGDDWVPGRAWRGDAPPPARSPLLGFDPRIPNTFRDIRIESRRLRRSA